MRLLRYLLAGSAIALTVSGCSIGSADTILGPAYAEEPETALSAETVCGPFSDLPPGVPLEGLGVAQQRQTAVVDAMEGEMVDRDRLAAGYDTILAAVETYAEAFEAADAAIEGDRPQPVNVAAGDWRAFHDALIQQRNATEDVLDVLAGSDAPPEEAAASHAYREAALRWSDTQWRVNLVANQAPWSHHRAVIYLSDLCGPLPDYAITPADG